MSRTLVAVMWSRSPMISRTGPVIGSRAGTFRGLIRNRRSLGADDAEGGQGGVVVEAVAEVVQQAGHFPTSRPR